MRKSVLLLLFGLALQLVYSQKQVSPENLIFTELDDVQQNRLSNLPELEMSEECKNRVLPYKVNNSETPYYRTPFTQAGLSCGQASSTGMCFTYEMNRARDLPANVNENLYPTHFVYNWANGDYGGGGASYYHTFEVLKKVGTPNQAEYGGTPDAGGARRWMSGYDLYYNAMKNRLDNAYKINVGTAEGMQTLKNWMYDRGNGTIPGGCAVTYTTNRYPQSALPAGTECEGMCVITQGNRGSSHSITFLGYNDSIRYDYNGDGRYTNDEDINGDGIIDMRDWEIGGLIASETYFNSTAWADNGYCFIMYKAFADGYVWNDIMHVMDVNPTYEPQLTAKINMTYTHRGKIKIYAGISNNMNSEQPEYIIDFPIFSYQGGPNYMQGGITEADKTIEFGLDLTPLLNFVNQSGNVKYFLQIYENDPGNEANGTINSFSIINYSSGTPIETICQQTNVNINNNEITTLSIGAQHVFDRVEITTDILPLGAVMSQYSTQLNASGGTTPYNWSFDDDYFVTKSSTIFQNEGTSISTNSSIDLNFNFNYFGEEYNRIYVNSNGFIFFENFETYIPFGNTGMETMLFYNNKCITPYYTMGQSASIKYINESNYIKIIWTSNQLKYSATLFEDGSIVFSYNDSNISSSTPYICGVSKGDGVNFNTIRFDNNFEIENGLTYTLSTYGKPEDFEISPDGELTGIPSREYYSELLHFKVTDNNGITCKKSLPFITDGIILNFNIHTSNGDNIIEYGEDVTLDLIINNPTDNQITNISIEASCSDEYITLITTSASSPDIDPLASETINNAFSFTVSNNIPNNYNFRIHFTITTDDATWEYFNEFTAYAPILYITDVEVNDNNDNILTVNETADLKLKINNFGGAKANGLTFVTSTDDPNITITNALLYAIDINQGSFYNYIVEITTSSEITETYNSIINVEVTGNNEFNEIITFEITIHLPVIEISNIYNTDNISAGETRDIGIDLINTSLLSASNITATLNSDSPYITINNNSQFFESIDVNEIKSALFNITFSENCNYGQEIILDMTITSDIGLNYTSSFIINVGYIIENFETGGFSYFIDWEHSGNSPWYIVTDDVYEGTYSLRSGSINDNQKSELKTSIHVLEEAPISFAYKVSSEQNYDKLKFYVDDVLIYSYSGLVPWSIASYTLSPGYHSLKWAYEKDYSQSRNADAAWLDNITFPPFDNSEPILECNVDFVEKIMEKDQQTTQNIIISNIGGRELNYQITLQSIETNSKNILGSSITTDFTDFIPGETYEITFTLNVVTPDSEWIKYVEIQFPDEIILNRASDIIGSNNNRLTWNGITGHGVNAIWTTQQNYGVIRNGESVEFSVNITFDESHIIPNSVISYKIIGDMFGSEPHTVESNITFATNTQFWLSVAPSNGNIPGNSENELLLTFNSDNLEPGLYNANIRIGSNANSLDIPVQLTVISEANLLTQTTSVYKELKRNHTSSEIITISNDGNQADFTVEIFDTDNPENDNISWLSVNPSHGIINYLDDMDFTLNFNSANLNEGSYHADLKVSAGNSQVTIPVELKVIVEALSCPTESIYKELKRDQEVTEIITISNSGCSTNLEINFPGNITWLSVDPPQTTINQDEDINFSVTFNSNSLGLGSYFAEIRFIGENSSFPIPVELKVIENDDNSILNITNNNEIICFPNPFSNSISVKLTSVMEEIKSLKLVDIMGKEVLTLDNNIKISGKEDTFTYNINESVPSGIYFIRIETNDSINFIKIVKK